MEWVAVAALSIIVAIISNFATPYVSGSKNTTVVKLQTSYAGRTLMTALVIFGSIVIAGLIFSAADKSVTV